MTAHVRQVSGTGIVVRFSDQMLVVDNTAAVASVQFPNPAQRECALSIVCLGDPAIHAVTLLQNATEKIERVASTFTMTAFAATFRTDGTDWYLVPSQLGAITSGAILSTIISPTALAAQTNDYSPTGFSTAQVIRLTATGPQDLTGCVPSTIPKLWINVDSADIITFKNESAGSSAANRFLTTFGIDFSLLPGGLNSLWSWYDTTSSRNRVAAIGGDYFTYLRAADSVLRSASQIDNLGMTRTIETAGQTGNKTINNMAGIVRFAAAAQTLTVTCNQCTANSIIYASVLTDDTTALIKNVVPASGSFVIKLNAAATAETAVGWMLVN